MKNSASFGYRFHQQECKEAHSTPPTFRRHVRWLKINQQTPSAPPHIKASRETWWTNQTQFAPTLLKASWWGEMPADIMAEDLREQSQVLLYTSWCRLRNKKGEMHSVVVLTWLDSREDLAAWLRHNQSRSLRACGTQEINARPPRPAACRWKGLTPICFGQRGLFYSCLIPVLCWYWCCISGWTQCAEVLSTQRAQLCVDC